MEYMPKKPERTKSKWLASIATTITAERHRAAQTQALPCIHRKGRPVGVPGRLCLHRMPLGTGAR